jgi:hypothetical protein
MQEIRGQAIFDRILRRGNFVEFWGLGECWDFLHVGDVSVKIFEFFGKL